ncbi:MAG: mannose-6-phosphate isomerase [Candidatus Aenigmarchaeota archaeon ex4484_52]|nr:MAG: mannose-6-phosphate isomerase [Candidatus Aenigmarchaeota archaeon ex4484_52]
MKIINRPWGNFRQFALNEKCTVKILTIKKQEELSLQIHKHRDEEWYFFNDAIVQLGKNKKKIKKGELIRIKKGIAHRIIADENDVSVLEISFGEFDEKDEIRLDDKYGRK